MGYNVLQHVDDCQKKIPTMNVADNICEEIDERKTFDVFNLLDTYKNIHIDSFKNGHFYSPQ